MKRDGNLLKAGALTLNLDMVAAFVPSKTDGFSTEVYCGGHIFTVKAKKSEFEKEYKEYLKSKNILSGKIS